MKYVVKKIGVLILMLFLVSFITFIAFSVIPGDSAITALGTEATEEALESMREAMGLNDSVPVRYVHWVKNVLKGDLNVSYQYNVSVSTLLKDKLPVTIWLAVMSISMISIVGIPIGVWLAKTKSKRVYAIVIFIMQLFMSIPPFFLGMILTLVFGIVLKLFVPGGYVSFREDPMQFISYMIYPAVAIALPKISMVSKFTMNSMKRESELDYVRTAYSKGARRNDVYRKHILKNGLLPIITFMGMVIADVLAGSIIVEQVFSIPGLGRLLVTSIGTRDLYVVQAIMLYIVSVVVIINTIVDLLYQWIDPRVRV